MVLMIWVNDFWTLTSIPKWLKHALAEEDYLGFSDLIFPWFLFVMGLSIPFAVSNRLKKGETTGLLFKHIIFRSAALITMGLFHMNMEMFNHEHPLIIKPVFVILCTSAFFMIWNDYSDIIKQNKLLYNFLRFSGILILFFMVFLFSGKDYNGSQIGFKTHWWGILGLIGWVYLITSCAYLFIQNSIIGNMIAFFMCILLNIISSSGFAYNIFSWQGDQWIPGNGGLQALTFGGIIVSLLINKFEGKSKIKRRCIFLSSIGMIIFLGGLYLKNFFAISKIKGTPSWIFISLSSAILFFVIIYWIVDEKGKFSWFEYINIAGTSTLTCYLIPYYYYNMISFSNWTIPIAFTSGIAGLIKSALFAFLIIGFTWIFSKIKLHIRI